MIDAKNVVILTGGLVNEPEIVGNGIVKFRLGVNWAGQDRINKDNRSGYFDVTYYTNDGNQNAEFVRKQVEEKKLHAASQVQIVGRLVQERFETKEGNKASNTVIYAESLTYAGNGPAKEIEGSGTEEVITPVAADF